MASLFPALLLCAASVHPDTINDIARVESGFNPYAVAEIIPERGSVGISAITPAKRFLPDGNHLFSVRSCS